MGLRSLTTQRAIYFLLVPAITCFAIVIVVASRPHHLDRAPLSGDACGAARFRVNQASDFSNAYRYRDAYDASLLGLKSNESCRDKLTKVVNEGFLYSTKAISEYFLSRGDSSNDLNHAITVLARCHEMASKLDWTISDRCMKQEQSDFETRGRLRKQITVP
jgi:hypothetical protein